MRCTCASMWGVCMVCLEPALYLISPSVRISTLLLQLSSFTKLMACPMASITSSLVGYVMHNTMIAFESNLGGQIDTTDENYMPPLSFELVAVLLPLLDKVDHNLTQRVFGEPLCQVCSFFSFICVWNQLLSRAAYMHFCIHMCTCTLACTCTCSCTTCKQTYSAAVLTHLHPATALVFGHRHGRHLWLSAAEQYVTSWCHCNARARQVGVLWWPFDCVRCVVAAHAQGASQFWCLFLFS